jgi:hypothetical protein
MKLTHLALLAFVVLPACGSGDTIDAQACEPSDAGDECASVADDELTRDQMERHLDDLEREIQEPRQ